MIAFRQASILWIAVMFLALLAKPVHAFNNDGKTDIVWRQASTGNNAVWFMNGISTNTSGSLTAWTGTNWNMVAVGDFDNDSKPDLLWRNTTTGANVIWFMDGINFLAAVQIQTLGDLNWEVVGTGYFGGAVDKSLDIVWRNKVTGDNAVWFMENGILLSSVLIQDVPDLTWKIAAVGDMNHDGFDDLIWRNSSTGQNAVWYMQGINQMFVGWIQTVSDTNWEIVGAGYFDAGNNLDLLWRNKSTGDSAIWLMNGTAQLSSNLLPNVATSWRVGGLGDAAVDSDQDSLPDRWERKFFGTLSQGPSGDYDGDGQTNLTEFQYQTDPSVSLSSPTIEGGVDSVGLVFTTGGSAPWSYDSTKWYSGDATRGYDSVKSGAIGNDQVSWIETKVRGPGTIQFAYMVSSQVGDYFNFTYTTETGSGGGTGNTGPNWWITSTVNIPAGTNTLRWQYSKDSSGLTSPDAVWVDYIRYTPTSGTLDPLAEAVDSPSRSFNTYGTGSTTWYPQSTTFSFGTSSAQNQTISHNQGIYMESRFRGPGHLTFDWKSSSEYNSDVLAIHVDGIFKGQISGITGWETKNLDLTNGLHTVQWGYSKDATVSQGSDTAWVDHLVYSDDLDFDGTADWWELQYFGSTTSYDGTADPDGDGIPNMQEYLNGTDPLQPELRMRISKPNPVSVLP